MNAEEFARTHPQMAAELTDVLRTAPNVLRIGLRPVWTPHTAVCVLGSVVLVLLGVGALLGIACSAASSWWLLAPSVVILAAVHRLDDLFTAAGVHRRFNAHVRAQLTAEQETDR